MSSTSIMYECPHCGAKIEIPDGAFGQDVPCPQCEKLFHIEVPVAEPVRDPAGRTLDSEADPRREDRQEEPTLRVFHQAEFRLRPLRTLLMSALVVGGVILAFLDWPWPIVGLCFALGGLSVLGVWLVMSYYTTLTITTDRSIYRRGIISKRTSEVQHDDIRNIQVDQAIIERLLGIGTVAISSAGQGDLEIVMQAVPHPDEAIELVRRHQVLDKNSSD